MLRKNINIKILFLNLLLLSFLIFINSQDTKPYEMSINVDCEYDFLNYPELYYNEYTELSEALLNDIVLNNYDMITGGNLLAHFGEDYQLFLFTNSSCTFKFLNFTEIENNFYNANSLHLFSIDFFIINNFFKLVVQTKKQFIILFYEIDTNGILQRYKGTEKVNYIIKTNLYPYFINNLIPEEYSIFEKESINIFNEKEKIFNDICYIFKSREETKSPELRKKLYYFKYDNGTYPLLESKDNCIIVNNSISYKNEYFILEYNCSNSLILEKNRIKITNNVLQQLKEEKEKYDGPNSLKDQEKLLYCNKEVYKADKIKKNVGFYISLFLLFFVFIFWIILIIKKYDLVKKATRDNPPKKKINLEGDDQKKKKVNFGGVEILSSGRKKKKKKVKPIIDDDSENNRENNNTVTKKNKKKKKKKKIKKLIDDNDNDNENKEDYYNNDLEWYSNNLDDNDKNKDDNNENSNENISNNSNNDIKIKIRRKKKKGKKKKKKRSLSNKIIKDEEKAKSDEEKEIYKNENNNDNNNDNDNKYVNKTMTNFHKAYNQFKENYAKEISSALRLRRLVIITNLGKNLEEIGSNTNNTNEIISNDDLKKKNSLLPMIKDNIVDNGQSEKNHILSKIVGFEDNSFLSNIKRDYLKYDDAIFYDNREFCSIFTHYLKLKVDLINIFCCNYSFAPYSIRIIKFLFFFHFMFYLETLCIGQKYYFKKHFSEEYQDAMKDVLNYIYNKNISGNNTSYGNGTSDYSFLEKYFSVEDIKLLRAHYLYTFKYSFPRIMIPMAISFISYFITTILSPRRVIMKLYLDPDKSKEDKFTIYKIISEKYKKIYIFFATLAMLLMTFFFYSITNYFVIFEDAKYDIPQSFILSGLVRFILDIIIWIIIANVRKLSVDSHSGDFYGFQSVIYELN